MRTTIHAYKIGNGIFGVEEWVVSDRLPAGGYWRSHGSYVGLENAQRAADELRAGRAARGAGEARSAVMGGTAIDPFAPAVIAADYVTAALGRDDALLAVTALRAGWLTADEAARLEPLAAAIARLLGEPLQPGEGS